MSLASIPRTVRMESQLADQSTLFNRGQPKAVRRAINYCSVVDPSIADLESLLTKIENDRVLSKKDRRRLQDVLNKHGKHRLDSDERRLNAWAKSELWDAHRPTDYWFSPEKYSSTQ